MARPDPALLKLVKEAFIILGDNTEAMNRLNSFVENQEKKTPSKTRRSDFYSLRSIYSKPGNDLLNLVCQPVKKPTRK